VLASTAHASSPPLQLPAAGAGQVPAGCSLSPTAGRSRHQPLHEPAPFTPAPAPLTTPTSPGRRRRARSPACDHRRPGEPFGRPARSTWQRRFVMFCRVSVTIGTFRCSGRSASRTQDAAVAL
jgi:hypothetical protein